MNRFDFDWGLAQSFLAALEHGSLTGAARATGVSQPTLGRHIADLEKQLQLVLFERTGRGLRPTAQALELADAARSMRDGAARVSRLASGRRHSVQGVVRLSASQPVACYLLPPILLRLRQALPEVQVELVVSNLVSNLLMREADIALRMVRPDQNTLVSKRIGQVTLRACASLDYLGRKGRPVQTDDLLVHDLITGDRNTEIQQGFAAWGFAADKLRTVLRTDDLVAQWAGIRAAIGVGFVATYLIRTDPNVSPLLPNLVLPKIPVWLTVHRELRTSILIRAVYDFLAEQVPIELQAGAPGNSQ